MLFYLNISHLYTYINADFPLTYKLVLYLLNSCDAGQFVHIFSNCSNKKFCFMLIHFFKEIFLINHYLNIGFYPPAAAFELINYII